MSRLFFVFLVISLVSCQKEIPKSPPNVILILTDDQGYGDLGLHGNDQIETPHLDKLGQESVRLDRFYVSPLCAPTRASLLTGRYHLRTGTVSVSNGLETMAAEEYTLAELFKDNGYATAIFGKWHNGQHYPHHPLAQGFDEFVGFLGGHWTNYFDTQLEKDQRLQIVPGYLPDVLTDAALDFMQRKKDQPFFLYLPYNTPHSPHQVPDEFFDPYKQAGLSDELAAVYGMVSNIDTNVGRILQKLEELDLDENTLVIFLTDNGPNGQRYNASMKGVKGSVNEGGVRVPSFWRWKGTLAPGLLSLPSAHIDVLPTLVDLLQLDFQPKKPLDGISLAAALQGEEQLPQRAIFSQVAFPQRPLTPFPGAIRRDSLLLVYGEQEVELFDLKNDPRQQKNLASTEARLAEQLKKEYETWWQDVSGSIDLDRPIPVSDLSPEVFLPGYEAQFTSGISFFEGHGWAQDWLTGWTSQEDSISWDLDVRDANTYEVRISYTANENQVPASFSLFHGEEQLRFTLQESFRGEIIPSINRIPRKEAPEQTWNKTTVGKISLKRGRDPLILKVDSVASGGVGDIYSLELSPVK
ncbi:arylsulfatase [Algoriphagus namhaensis]